MMTGLGCACEGAALWISGALGGGVAGEGAGTVCGIARTRSHISNMTAYRECWSSLARLFQRIDCEAAEQLGIKIRGFLWKDLARESDVAYLLHSCRIHQQGQVCFSAANQAKRFGHVTNVCNILLVADRLLGNA